MAGPSRLGVHAPAAEIVRGEQNPSRPSVTAGQPVKLSGQRTRKVGGTQPLLASFLQVAQPNSERPTKVAPRMPGKYVN